jgi:hypothetical protein
MLLVSDITRSGGLEWEFSFQQFESLDEAYEVWRKGGENPEDVNLAIINAAAKQNAAQSTGKGDVRKAAEKHGEDSLEVEEAIAAMQKKSADYIIGRPRGGKLGGLMTTTEAREKGKGIAAAGPEAAAELQALAEKYGL